jgi:YVTN family beta-propeller protein
MCAASILRSLVSREEPAAGAERYISPMSTPGGGPVKASHRRGRLLALALLSAGFAFPHPAEARNVYVVNQGSASVSVIDTATNTVVGTPIPVGTTPREVAITPDGTRAYVTNSGSASVSVIDTASNSVVGAPIAVGTSPWGVAITPDGTRVYVANQGSASVSVIDTASNSVVGAPIAVGAGPRGIGITPDGMRAYVANGGASSVSVIDTATNTVVGTPIPVSSFPDAFAITPNGTRAFLADVGSGNVTAINTATNTVIGSPLPMGDDTSDVAITPGGSRAYAPHGTVTVIDTATNTAVGAPIAMGADAFGLAITPDGARAYVAADDPEGVRMIDTLTNSEVGMPIPVGTEPREIAIVPGQGPTPSFTVDPKGRTRKVAFDAAGSSDPDGSVTGFEWEFGDGQVLTGSDATPTHTYAQKGTYTAILTVTDNEGCSTTKTFTGQTVYCNPSGNPVAEAEIDLDPPSLKLFGKRTQELAKKVTVKVKADEDGEGTAKGWLVVRTPGKGSKRAELRSKKKSYKLKRATKPLTANQKRALKPKLTKKAFKAAKKALRSGGRVTAKLTVSAADAIGNTRQKKLSVKLKR